MSFGPVSGKEKRGYAKSPSTTEIVLPDPTDLFRSKVNSFFDLLFRIGGTIKVEGINPQNVFWYPSESIERWKRGVSPERLTAWVNTVTLRVRGELELGAQAARKAGREDEATSLEGQSNALFDTAMALTKLVAHIHGNDWNSSVCHIPGGYYLRGPRSIVESLARKLENNFLFTLLTSLKEASETLGAKAYLTEEFEHPALAIASTEEMWSFIRLPFVPKGPDGEDIQLERVGGISD
jgi:hypothetical protein